MPRSYAHSDRLAGPPPEVLDEIDAAWERAQEAALTDLELAFESEPRPGAGMGSPPPRRRHRVERVPAAVAVALCCGDADLWPPHLLPV